MPGAAADVNPSWVTTRRPMAARSTSASSADRLHPRHLRALASRGGRRRALFRSTPVDSNANAAAELIAKAIAGKPFDYWRQHLRTMKGQWAPFQSLIDLAADEQAIANDMIAKSRSRGGKPFRVVRGRSSSITNVGHDRRASLRAHGTRSDGDRDGLGPH